MDKGTAMTSGAPRPTDKTPTSKRAGFTLLELMVVLVIIAIMATQVVFMYTNPLAKVKAAAFNLRADINLARSEAVSRHQNVLVEFIPGDIDGYKICIDSDGDNTCTDEDDNNTIKAVDFREEVQFYDKNATDGPLVKPGGGAISFEDGDADDDGIAFNLDRNWFLMQPDGTSSGQGTVYLCVPQPDDHAVVLAQPLAMVVSTATGRVRLERWWKTEGAWKDK